MEKNFCSLYPAGDHIDAQRFIQAAPASWRRLRGDLTQAFKLMFDIPRMTKFAIESIVKFSMDHRDEKFYAFAIDADMLCLNSEEKFAETLLGYQKNWPGKYFSADAVADLKQNTGDWIYQGFCQIKESNGFDFSLYQKHYEEPSPGSEYGKAMSELLNAISADGVLSNLNRTDDFYITWVDHNY